MAYLIVATTMILHSHQNFWTSSFTTVRVGRCLRCSELDVRRRRCFAAVKWAESERVWK
jgi:hypothetical protein